MAATGKNTRMVRKKDLAQQNTPAVGIRKLVFAHQAVAGETGFNLLSLTTPTSMTANGFAQPSAAQLASAHIFNNRSNLQIVSTARPAQLLDYISYTVNSANQITFLPSFGVAQAGEIFVCTLTNLLTTGTVIVDSTPIALTGTLAAGATDFVVGTPFETNKNSNYQIGAIKVEIDGVPVLRNVGNATAAAGADGDFQEVDNGSGLSNVIRFNVADPVNARTITVVSMGLNAFRPDNSVVSAWETIAGQMDKVVQVLAATSGQSTSYFQNNPNAIDQRQFGTTVYGLVKTPRLISSAVQVNVRDQIFLDSSAGAFSCTLPASASFGDTIEIYDAVGQAGVTGKNVTFLRNGQAINGSTATDLIFNVSGGRALLFYVNATQGWRVY